MPKEAQKELVFTRRVLGPQATDRLEKHLVTQTLRSAPEDWMQSDWTMLLVKGEPVPVRIRYPGNASNALGDVNLKSVERVKWSDLTLEDPHRGGFDDLGELASALRRAGFRFKPLEEYSFFRGLRGRSGEIMNGRKRSDRHERHRKEER